MNWVDMVIVVILIINIIEGMSRGFIISLFNLTGFFISAYIAKLYYPILVGYIYNNPHIIGKLKDFIYRRVYKIMETNPNGKEPSSTLSLFKVPKTVEMKLFDNSQFYDSADGLMYSTESLISETLTSVFITIISILLVFFIVRFLLMIAVNIINSVAQLPILKQLNAFTGLIFGLVKGVLIIFILFTLLTPIISLYPQGFIAKGTFESNLGQYFYYNNIILNYLNQKGFFIY